jgi:retron-type reverse transcriptase
MKMILEEIYEGQFLNTSHGFRPSQGCHSALEKIHMNWTGISWFLEFDVEKCFDSIDRHRLISILKEDILDQWFFDLIFKLFNAGMIGWREGGPNHSEGVSQGSVLSPILCNIYLHKLDLEVDWIIKEYMKGKKR